MIQFSPEKLKLILDRFQETSLVVIGDFMLDRYVWGKVSRISPEAPVPVVEVESESVRLGGAANVVLNVSKLGASVFPIGLVGKDAAGEELVQILQDQGFSTEGLLTDESRPTTVKSRIIAHDQHVVRADWEQNHPAEKKIQDHVLDLLKRSAPVHGIVLEDYNKGMFSAELIHRIIEYANERYIPVYVDPKYDHFFDYQNVTVFKPNRKETSERLNISLKNEEDVNRAGNLLLENLHCQAVLITLGERGMVLFQKDESPKHVETKAVKVHDVSGAGDTVIATMAVANASGCTLIESATLANYAAGIVCGEVGVVPISGSRLYEVMLDDSKPEHTPS
ncbi:D-glycero-beta-D-manno-heptose-7-phosphate kinase [bacterium]|nr:D-glycero-beta-D-manno-heptose-7-phosphate kinase [bacterium]